uniref:SHSP domain-containing protein n=1 Tax=Oryza meridionalis TaxID=40149 RepID=A0A0E0C3Z1_9ORYZ
MRALPRSIDHGAAAEQHRSSLVHLISRSVKDYAELAALGKLGAMAEQQQQRDGDFEPVYEWLDAGGHYLLRVHVPEFKKEDFQVHVDPAGRLTVRGQHGGLRLNKVFQLPPTCNLDAITGRLEASVLVLTVPKKPATTAAAAATLPPKAKQEEEEKETKKADEHDVAGTPPPPPPTTMTTDHKGLKTDGDQAEPRTQLAAREKKEEPPKATAPAGGAAARERHDEEEKARAEHKARLSREADKRIEAARARLAAQQAASRPAPAPAPAPEKTAAWWMERAAEEGMKLAEAIGKNKEVVATAVAAFALGVFVSTKLFSRSN